MKRIHFGDNLSIIKTIPDGSVNLVYIDPPFNTGKRQVRTQIRTVRSEDGDRKGFSGNSYTTIPVSSREYADSFDDYESFIRPRMEEIFRVLAPNGSLYFHIDYREAHHSRIWLDEIFGTDCFLNEIIWSYDYGGRPRDRWPAKHDNILYYVKNPQSYTFNREDIDRIPYMAPDLVGPEKAARGKLPTDVWWNSIVGTNSREKTGYPSQKPLTIINRIITASSNPGDLVMDIFAGSGTVGQACINLGRQFILADNSLEAMEVMAKRFAGIPDLEWFGYPPNPA